MRDIPKKNYIILLILLVVTAVLSFSLAQVYKERSKKVSYFYDYCNKVTVEGFQWYITENRDAIIYISDKYSLERKDFEHQFQNKIDSLNLKNNVVFIDVNDINDKFLNTLKKDYKLDLDIDNYPILIVIVDNSLVEVEYIDEYSNAENIIDYSKFE